MLENDRELSHIRFGHREFTLFLVAIILVLSLFFGILFIFFNTPVSSLVFGCGALADCFIFAYYLTTKKVLNCVKLILFTSFCVILGNTYSYGGIFSPSIWWFSAFAVYVGIFFGKRFNRILVGILFFTIFTIYLAHKFSLFPEPEFVGAGKEELFFMSNMALLVITVFFNKLNTENFSGLLFRTKNLEKQAYISANMASLGEMASSVAHEINNPLAIIKGNFQSIEKELSKDGVTNENIEKKMANISRAIDRAVSIVSSLRSISRGEKNDRDGISTIEEVLGHITNLMSEKLRENGISLEVDIDDEDLHTLVPLAPVFLSQVFLSLINNSIESLSKLEDKWIKITANIESDSFVVNVIDSGNGINSEVQGKMFNPLFSTKDVGKGTGLGLSISRSMLEKSGAELFYKDLDGYTCFCLNLPTISPS